MLPSRKRLSRLEFTQFLASKDVKVVFNPLGTLKYKKSLISQASVVISSKHEKRAVYRNKLRRRIYSIFEAYFKDNNDQNQYILYISKQAPSFEYSQIKAFLYELLKKTTK